MKGKKNILVFVDWYTPAYKAGGPIQSVASIVHTFQHECNFFVLTGDRDLGDDLPMSVPIDEWVIRDDCKVMYLSPDKRTRSHYASICRENRCDLVYINSLFSIDFTLKPLLALRKEVPRMVIAPRGMLGAGALKIKSTKKRLFLKCATLLRLFDDVEWHASSNQEQQEIIQVFRRHGQVHVAMNLPSVAVEKLGERAPKTITDSGPKFLFVSRLSKKKNLHLALGAMLPLALKYQFTFTIIGPIDEPDYWKRCTELIEKFPANRILVLGAQTPTEVVRAMDEHHFFVLPTAHENYGHVIIEAMYCGCPVLISPHTPWVNVEENSIGWLLDPTDIDQISDQMVKAIKMSDQQLQIMSERAVEYAHSVRDDKAALAANRSIFLGVQ